MYQRSVVELAAALSNLLRSKIVVGIREELIDDSSPSMLAGLRASVDIWRASLKAALRDVVQIRLEVRQLPRVTYAIRVTWSHPAGPARFTKVASFHCYSSPSYLHPVFYG